MRRGIYILDTIHTRVSRCLSKFLYTKLFLYNVVDRSHLRKTEGNHILSGFVDKPCLFFIIFGGIKTCC